jgi:glutathione peroxidase-family protein
MFKVDSVLDWLAYKRLKSTKKQDKFKNTLHENFAKQLIDREKRLDITPDDWAEKKT